MCLFVKHTLHRYTESTVQSTNAIRLEDLGQAVTQSRELALSSALADISSQTIRFKQKKKYKLINNTILS